MGQFSLKPLLSQPQFSVTVNNWTYHYTAIRAVNRAPDLKSMGVDPSLQLIF